MAASVKRDVRYAHDCLIEWADWHLRHIESAGYNSATIESRLISGDVGGDHVNGSRVLECVMPARIAKTDRAVKDMPEELREIVRYKYQQSGGEIEKREVWRRDTGQGLRCWDERIKAAHIWILGHRRALRNEHRE